MTAMLPIHAETARPERRPRLLMRAARIGLADYQRDRDLKRILPVLAEAGGGDLTALERLTEAEARLEQARQLGMGYSALRHIDVLIALLAERRLHPADDRPIA